LLALTAAEAAAQYPEPPRGGSVTQGTPGSRIEPGSQRPTDIPVRGWTVTPSIEVRESYTDNVFLGVGEPRSDFITQVTPGINIEGRSPRLLGHLTYAPSAIFYADNSDANDFVNYLDAFGRLEAVEKFFFIEAAANVNQSFISPFAPQPNELIFVTENRVETRTFSLSPYVRSEGPNLEYELRNRNTWTNSDVDGLGKFQTRQWTGRVGNPIRRFAWSLEFDDTEIRRYDLEVTRPEDKSRLYRARLYYQPDPAWRFSVSAGSEENNYILNQMQRTDIYGAAVAWRPSPRTSADLAYEERFFGPSRLVRFNHRTRLTAWSVAYSRNTSSYQEEVLRLPPGNATALLDGVFSARFPDADQRRAAVEEFMRAHGTPAFLSNSLAFYTQRVYLREGVDASFAIVGTRNSMVFTAFASENSNISADLLGALPDNLLFADRVKEHGFGVNAAHRLTPATSIGANATRVFSRRDDPVRINSRDDYANLLLTHTVGPKTVTFAGISATRFESDEAGFFPGQDANTVFIGLNHRF
jgi:uncharacterized protein (PEP-CTERM system associated)